MAHGATVEFAANDSDAIQATAAGLAAAEHRARGEVVDLSDPGQVETYFRGIAERHGRMSVLVNSVGIQRYGTVESTPPAMWSEVLRVNLGSMFLTSKYAVPLLRRNGGGAIILVSSGQAVASQKNCAAYVASKGAILSLTRAMAIDYARENIRVNSVCPGSVVTPMLIASARDISPEDPDGVIAGWGSKYPMGRVGEAAEIASAIAFLASPLASFVTGADLRVDGGILAGVPLESPPD